jgi:Ca2+-binding RTX toxin-like protein
LDGGAGNDTLIGGDGHDLLRGDLGSDVFRFSTDTECGIGANADIIMDFTAGQDIIDLTGIDANAVVAGNQAFSFLGTGNFTNTAGQLRYSSSGDGYTRLSADQNGDGIADFEIALTGTLSLTSASFLL